MTTRRPNKHRSEEVVAKLRDADVMLNAGKDLEAVLQALEISESNVERPSCLSCSLSLRGIIGVMPCLRRQSRTRWQP